MPAFYRADQAALVSAIPVAKQLIPPTQVPQDKAEKAVVMLAQGIVATFQQVIEERIIRQSRETPDEMQAAQCLLAELYVLEGKEELASDLHGVMERCKLPFKDPGWQLDCLAQPNFAYRDVSLVRLTLAAPTPDCAELAQMAGWRGATNLYEFFAHRRLRDMVDDVRKMVPDAYRLLREGIARHAFVVESQLSAYLVESDLGQLRAEVRRHFYDRVPSSMLIDGRAYRCAGCGALMHPHPDRERYPNGLCPIPSCGNYRFAEALDPRRDGELLVAKPHILEYWVAPATDELRVYDAARARGMSAVLYPGEDLADISLGGGRECGIDVKAYASPSLLAHRLKQGIGGLAKFKRKILAVSDYCVTARPDYKERLRQQWSPNDPAWALELMTVSEVLQVIEGRV